MGNKMSAWERDLLAPRVRRGSRPRTLRPSRAAARVRVREPQPPTNPRKAIQWHKNRILAERETVHSYNPGGGYGGYRHPSYKSVVAAAAKRIRESRAAIRELRG